MQRARIAVHGSVQGVGFRPHAWRLASEFVLAGWVMNSAAGVVIEVEGRGEAIERFVRALEQRRPPSAQIDALDIVSIDPCGEAGFSIRPTRSAGPLSAAILPDLATCAECLHEVFDPQDRRHLYPFTNCTHCGPRFSIVEALPYDRDGTTMRAFAMCPACRAEYDDPADRRFHAQANACPTCGPQLALRNAAGEVLGARGQAWRGAARALRAGYIVAVMGLGGFHLWADARNADAVTRLRQRKRRADKPFAIMLADLAAVRAQCELSDQEAELLNSTQAPIVLLRRRDYCAGPLLAEQVAPGSPELGVMLPYTPLHHLLMRELDFPVVATSGNRSEEPIATDTGEALERLSGIADLFLVHDRPIARPVEDSVARIVLGSTTVLRRGRGYAPSPLTLPRAGRHPVVLATGAQMKNTVSLLVAGQVITSSHIGDLDAPEARDLHADTMRSLTTLYAVAPAAIACDLHPDYASTHYAERRALPLVRVQHHVAHVAACIAENGLRGPVLGVAWDGTGYGADGSIWGGEFLVLDGPRASRVAHLRPFRLPGGDRAVREPRRAALGALYEALGEAACEDLALGRSMGFSRSELRVLYAMMRNAINAPLTSSAGRLFDALAAIAGVRLITSYEGQAAVEFEWCIDEGGSADLAPLAIIAPTDPAAPRVLDWAPTVRSAVQAFNAGVSPGRLAAASHRLLAAAIVALAEEIGIAQVVLTGGCFQNRHLLTLAVEGLRAAHLRPVWHRRIPTNDGGIALGQVAWAATQCAGG